MDREMRKVDMKIRRMRMMEMGRMGVERIGWRYH